MGETTARVSEPRFITYEEAKRVLRPWAAFLATRQTNLPPFPWFRRYVAMRVMNLGRHAPRWEP